MIPCLRRGARRIFLCVCLSLIFYISAISGSAPVGPAPEISRDLDSPFGMSGAWSRPFVKEDPTQEEGLRIAADLKEPYKDAHELGVRWIRTALDLYWSLIQPGREYVDNGLYRWDVADNLYGRVPDGMNILANIRVSRQGIKEGTWEFLNQYAKDRYVQFVKKVVERYDGNGTAGMPGLKNPIKYWQVENEPAFLPFNDGFKSFDWKGFAHLQEITYKAIKETDPLAKVAIGGMATGCPNIPTGCLLDEADPGSLLRAKEYEFYSRILKELHGKYVDILDIHYYGIPDSPAGSPWPENWRGMSYIYKQMRQELDKNGYKNTPVWFTETSVPSRPYGERAQAESLIKRYVYPLSFGVKKIFWYNLIEGEAPINVDKPQNHYGLIFDGLGEIDEKGTKDPGYGVKKLAYYTYKKMIDVLEGSDWNNIKTVRGSNGIHSYRFSRNKKQIWVAWNDRSQEEQISISGISSGQVKITEAVPRYESGKDIKNYDTAFHTEMKRVERGAVALTLGNSPVFVEEK